MLKQPIVVPAPKSNKYSLYEDYLIEVLGEKIRIPQYFQFEVSVPQAFWQLTCTPFDPTALLAGAIHDWLYYNHQCSREKADAIFKQVLIMNGMDNFTSDMMYRAVRVAGAQSWENTKKDEKYLMYLRILVKDNPHFNEYKFPEL